MLSMKALSVLLFVAIYTVYDVNAICRQLCVHYYGARYSNSTQGGAQLILTQITPTRDLDPVPCCNLCDETPNCGLYDIEFNNGTNAECKLFSLPPALLINSAYLGFIRQTNDRRCIGFPYKFIGFPSNDQSD